METANRQGQVLVELLVICLFFLIILIAIEVKRESYLKAQKKYRWETTYGK